MHEIVAMMSMHALAMVSVHVLAMSMVVSVVDHHGDAIIELLDLSVLFNVMFKVRMGVYGCKTEHGPDAVGYLEGLSTHGGTRATAMAGDCTIEVDHSELDRSTMTDAFLPDCLDGFGSERDSFKYGWNGRKSSECAEILNLGRDYGNTERTCVHVGCEVVISIGHMTRN